MAKRAFFFAGLLICSCSIETRPVEPKVENQENIEIVAQKGFCTMYRVRDREQQNILYWSVCQNSTNSSYMVK